MKEYICCFPVWTGGLTPSFLFRRPPPSFSISPAFPWSLEEPSTKFPCPRIVHNWSGIHRDEKKGGKVEESFDVENMTRFELLFSFCRTGRVFISDEDLKPERSVSVHRSNSFLCLNSSSAMWITNRMLFDHPLYGLNVDRVLGFHDYTLGQVTCSTLGHTFFWQTMKNVNVSTEVTRCSFVSFKSHFVVYMRCFFFLCVAKTSKTYSIACMNLDTRKEVLAHKNLWVILVSLLTWGMDWEGMLWGGFSAANILFMSRPDYPSNSSPFWRVLSTLSLYVSYCQKLSRSVSEPSDLLALHFSAN